MSVEGVPAGPELVAAQGPDADEQEKRDRLARYSSPEFTQQLLDHIREAVRMALHKAQEQRGK
jgi:hypothetical protein